MEEPMDKAKAKRVKVCKRHIPVKVWREAESIAGGLYRMNARTAFGYGFNFNDETKKINYGEFLFEACGDRERLPKFDGYISFK